jgi:tetratricopeptide (TPR) repeat protein
VSLARYVSFLAALLAFACAHERTRDPDGSAKRLAVGQDYYSKNLVAPALVEIQRALDLDGENPEAYYMMGVLKMGQGVEHLEIAERAHCLQGPAAAVERGDASSRMREAEENFKLAIRYRPNYAEAYDGLAVVASYTKDYDAAVRYESEAQKNVVFAENPIARGNLGWAYYGKRDLVRAEKELRDAVAKAPRFCVGRYRLGQVLFDEADYSGAVDELTQVEKLGCPIQEAFRVLGLARERQHEMEEAGAAFSRCVKLAPKSCMAAECARYAKLLSESGS